MTYKYFLDTTSKKYICPRCTKKSFVRYVDRQTNNYLDISFGRCDRETKCQYFRKPHSNQLLKDVVRQESHPVSVSYHDTELLSKYSSSYIENNLFHYLSNIFEKEEVKSVFRKYGVGTSTHWRGATVFFQIDYWQQVRAGKIMLYNSSSGKRVKNPYNHINWIHKVLHLNNFELHQCLFGIHLLQECKTSTTICITESEKTAIVMSIVFSEYIWLATGSKSNFKETLLKPLKGYQIIAYPDKTEFDNWNKKCQKLKEKGYSIICSDLLENQDLQDGDDLVDLLLSNAAF